MIEITEFCAKLQAILNGTAPNVSALTRPSFTLDGQQVYFNVKSPSLPHTDDLTPSGLGNASSGMTLPVMVEQSGSGQYEAYPNALMWSAGYQMTFLFPVVLYSDILLFYQYLADAVNGIIVNFGSVSGSVCCALGAPSFGQMRYLEAYQFDPLKASVSALFGERVCVSREWASLTLTFYMSGAKGLNEAGGFVYGNQVSYSLEVTFPSPTGDLFESLSLVSPSEALSTNAYEQQAISASQQSALPQNAGQGITLACFVKADAFWAALITAKRNGTLPSLPALLSTDIIVGGSLFWSPSSDDPFSNCMIKDVQISADPGKPMTAVLTIEPKATVATV